MKWKWNVLFIIVWPFPIEGQPQWAYDTLLLTFTYHTSNLFYVHTSLAAWLALKFISLGGRRTHDPQVISHDRDTSANHYTNNAFIQDLFTISFYPLNLYASNRILWAHWHGLVLVIYIYIYISCVQNEEQQGTYLHKLYKNTCNY